MIIRQSTIKQFMACSLRYKFEADGAPREQSSALSFGTVIHECVELLEVTQRLDSAIARFEMMWSNLEMFDLGYDYIIPRNTHTGYLDLGRKILREWWAIIQWESDIVLAREYSFTVPFGDHYLSGTADKVALRPTRDGGYEVCIIDYKTSAKAPTRDYLRHDLQFTVYAYATTQKEFWANIPDGDTLFQQLENAPRTGEWVHLRTARRITAGERNQIDYNRLKYAVNQIEAAISCGIFVPDISGSNCEYCEFRQQCGLPSREEELQLAA